MIETIIFDMAEVLVMGMWGIEKEVSKQLSISEEKAVRDIINGLGEDRSLLFTGRITEEEYWLRVIEKNGYPERTPGYGLTVNFLKAVIRRNFTKVPGTDDIVKELADAQQKLVILSDNAAEWVGCIEARYRFLRIFDRRFYSYNIGYTKKSPNSFLYVLEKLGSDPAHTLFIDDVQRNLNTASSPPVNIAYTHRFTDAMSLRKALVDLEILKASR